MITIFTDGSSRGNPGPGGWGAIVVSEYGPEKANRRFEKLDEQPNAHLRELGGAEKNTTNNRMELRAAVGALRAVRASKGEIQGDGEVLVYTDSSYVINGITKWIHGWKRNGWKTQDKADVLNKDLWVELAEECQNLNPKWRYVGGHVGILGNERCDRIATGFADGRAEKLFEGALVDYDLPDILNISIDESKVSAKRSESAHARAKAYSYVSMINGAIETHRTWAECEKRVKGAKGAKYRKSVSVEGEKAIISEFEAI